MGWRNIFETVTGDSFSDKANPVNLPENTANGVVTSSADEAAPGETVTITTMDGDREYIISAFYQSMNNMGSEIRLHSDADINYVQAMGGLGTQISFTDQPDIRFHYQLPLLHCIPSRT